MPETTVNNIDRLIILATQAGLPVTREPYHDIALRTGLDQDTVMERMKMMLERGVIRRIGVVPNHYRLGYRANGMSVWDVRDDRIDELGKKIGALEYVIATIGRVICRSGRTICLPWCMDGTGNPLNNMSNRLPGYWVMPPGVMIFFTAPGY